MSPITEKEREAAATLDKLIEESGVGYGRLIFIFECLYDRGDWTHEPRERVDALLEVFRDDPQYLKEELQYNRSRIGWYQETINDLRKESLTIEEFLKENKE